MKHQQSRVRTRSKTTNQTSLDIAESHHHFEWYGILCGTSRQCLVSSHFQPAQSCKTRRRCHCFSSQYFTLPPPLLYAIKNPSPSFILNHARHIVSAIQKNSRYYNKNQTFSTTTTSNPRNQTDQNCTRKRGHRYSSHFKFPRASFWNSHNP
jgi:hypothetical protein